MHAKLNLVYELYLDKKEGSANWGNNQQETILIDVRKIEKEKKTPTALRIN